jgi:hypothetical protein
MLERSEREKDFVHVRRREQTYLLSLALKGYISSAEIAQEILAFLLHIPLETSYVALFLLA